MLFDRGLETLLSIIARLSLGISALGGWRRMLAAFTAGSLSVLALPPVHFLPILFLTLPLLVWLIDGVGREELLLTRASSWRARRRVLRAAALVG